MTVKEIAELAGVSIGTVDRVLYHRGRVSPATKSKIEDIIERYQFTPNPLARSLKRSRPYCFCALLPRREQDAGYWEQIVSGIRSSENVVAALGVKTEIVEYDRYSTTSFYEVSTAVIEKKPDGIIFAPLMPDTTRAFIAKIQEKGIPYLFIDSDIPEMKPRCVIGQDSFQSGYLAGRLMHLFAGEGPMAVLDAHGEDYHIKRRRDGFLSYASEHDLSTVVHSGYQGSELSRDEVALFLREQEALAGIFVTNCMAHRVAEVLKPGFPNFTIIGYDLIPNNRYFLQNGGITAIISQNPEEQGRQALLNLYRSVVLEQRIALKIEIPINIYLKENIPPENTMSAPILA